MIILLLLYKRHKSPTDFVFSNAPIQFNPSITEVTILNLLGSGNFGEVYRGQWKGREVALKRLKNVEQIVEFEKELDILKSLHHPNIVQCYGTYTNPEEFKYIVTELCDGDVLTLVHSEETLPLFDKLLLAKEAAHGLLYLASQQIVHADIGLVFTKQETILNTWGRLQILGCASMSTDSTTSPPHSATYLFGGQLLK